MKLLLPLFLLLAALARATEVTDLGDGLGYLRPAALSTAVRPVRGDAALVLDLRRTTSERDALAPFAAALRERPAGARLFVLVGPETPEDIAALLAPRPPGVVTLGIAGSRPAPAVVVAQAEADDRAAWLALEQGATLADLISGKVDKDHFDESTLVKEFKNGNHDARPAPGNPDGTPRAPAHRTDRVLQRAVHLHRALLALRR